jgi:phenylacetate-CoA ligase
MVKTNLFLSMLKWRRRFKQHERWNRDQLESHQAQALNRLREFVYARSPFYQRFHRRLYQAPLREVPVLTKSLFMENFDDLVTDRRIHLDEIRNHLKRVPKEKRYQGRYWIIPTSATTGDSAISLFNNNEWAAVLASGTRSYDWAGVRVRPFHRIRAAAIVSKVPTNMTARVTGTIQFWWFPTLRMSASDPLSLMVERLNKWQPEILQAYAGIAALLAEEQLSGRLKISPRVIATGSETLSGTWRERIESAWNGRLFDRYACAETGMVASECDRHRGLHFYEDLHIVEIVDELGRPASPGEPGNRVLITDLSKYTQPIIRYDLGDFVRTAVKSCSCGRPFVLAEELQGRTREILHFPSVNHGQVVLQPSVFHQVMDALPINGWQIVQEEDGLEILIRRVPDDFSDESLVKSIQRAMSAMGAIVPPIRVKRVLDIPGTYHGKTPLIKSNLREKVPVSKSAPVQETTVSLPSPTEALRIL